MKIPAKGHDKEYKKGNVCKWIKGPFSSVTVKKLPGNAFQDLFLLFSTNVCA